MKFELINWLRVNGVLLLGVIVSLDGAFLFGYLVLSDIPFLQFVDLALVSSVSAQAALFILLAAPALLFQLRMNLIEGMIPIGTVLKERNPFLGLSLFAMVVLGLVIFVRDLRPGFFVFSTAIAAVLCLYHPTKTHSVGATDLRKFGKLLVASPKRTWRLAIKPYYTAMFRDCAWLFAMILFVWVGFLRFSYVSSENIQLLVIEGGAVQTAIVGRNSIGLIGRSEAGDYSVYPLDAISQIALPRQ